METEPQPQTDPSQNARKHGLFARDCPLFATEGEAFDELLAEYLDEWQPAGPTERDLVRQLVSCVFRASRIRAMETASIDYQTGLLASEIKKIDRIDAPLAQTLTYESKQPHIDFLGRHEARLERMAREARKQLVWLQDRRARKAAAEAKSLQPRLETKNVENEIPEFLSINDALAAGLVPGLDNQEQYQHATQKLAAHFRKLREAASPPGHADLAKPKEPPYDIAA